MTAPLTPQDFAWSDEDTTPMRMFTGAEVAAAVAAERERLLGDEEGSLGYWIDRLENMLNTHTPGPREYIANRYGPVAWNIEHIFQALAAERAGAES